MKKIQFIISYFSDQSNWGVLGANQSLRTNYENFNLSYWINIQRVWGLGNFTIWPPFGLCNHTFANPPFHLSAPLPLDVDLMLQIEVSIVCTERLVCTSYVPYMFI